MAERSDTASTMLRNTSTAASMSEYPHPEIITIDDEELVVRWRHAILSRQHFLGIDRALDVAVRPFAADDREVRPEPPACGCNQRLFPYACLLFYKDVPAAAVVRLQHERIWQAVER